MHGVHLASLNSSDMMDAIHYMFEEDIIITSKEEAESRDRVRVSIYDTMYGQRYKYSSVGSTSGSFDFDNDPGLMADQAENDLTPFDPSTRGTGSSELPPVKVRSKGYVPPTDFNSDSAKPFGKVLDAPMN